MSVVQYSTIAERKHTQKLTLGPPLPSPPPHPPHRNSAVLTDKQARKVIQQRPGFKARHKMAMAQVQMSMAAGTDVSVEGKGE